MMHEHGPQALPLSFIEKLIDAFTRFVEAVAELADVLGRQLLPDLERLRAWVERYTERCRRERLAHTLRHYHVSTRVAVLIAYWWPLRWLPMRAIPPPR